MQLGVSVIVCCYNSSIRLPETLRHLAQQKVPAHISWEIILINNSSKDETVKIAYEEWEKHKSKGIRFNISDQPLPGLLNARKKGIEVALYEYLLFCDDDNWLSEKYISTVFKIMNGDKLIGALGGCGIIEAEQPARLNEELLKKTTVSGSQKWALTDHWVYGAGATYRKSVIDALFSNGWQQITLGRTGTKLVSGEDVEICFMIYLCGYKIQSDDRLIFKHFVPLKRQSIAFITDMAFWLSYTNVLLNSYFAIIHNDKRPIKKILDNWFLGISKTLIKQIASKAYKSIEFWKQPSIEEKIASKNVVGTFYSLLQNRKKIVAHYTLIKKLQPSIGTLLITQIKY